MAGSVATAYVNLVPKFSPGLTSAMSSAFGGSAATGAGSKFGGLFSRGAQGGITSGLGGWLKGGAVAGLVSSAASGVAGAVSSSLDSAISRVDTMNNFPNVMKNLGISSKDATKAVNAISDGLNGLPTTLDAGTAAVQRFTSYNGDVQKSTKMFLAVNDAILAGGSGPQMQASALEQLSQSYTKGKMDMMEWRTLQQAMPAQLKQVAKSMGYSVEQLGAGLRGAEKDANYIKDISMDDFIDEIMKLDKKGGQGLASFQEQAKSATGGIGTQLTNMRTALSRNVANIIDELHPQITGGIKAVTGFINAAGAGITDFVGGLTSAIDFEGFERAFAGVGEAVSSAFGGDNATRAESFGTTVGNAVNGLIPIIEAATPVIGTVAGAFKTLADHAQEVAPVVIGVASGVAILKGASAVSGVVTAIGGALSTMGVGGTAAAGGLESLAGGEAAAGTAATTAAPSLLEVGAAVLMVGGGVLLAAAGMYVLAQAAISLVSAGPMAGVAMAALVVGIVGLGAAAMVAGPALTAGALGIIAFGAAVALVGAGVMLACTGVAMLAGQLPVIAAFGASAGAALAVLGSGLLTAGAGALVAGAGLLVLGAGAAVAGVGLVVAAAGALLLGAGIAVLGAGVMVAAAGLAMMGAALPMIGAMAPVAAAGLVTMAAASAAAAPALGVLAAAALGATAGVAAFGFALAGPAGDAEKFGNGIRTATDAMGWMGPLCSTSAAAVVLLAAAMSASDGAFAAYASEATAASASLSAASAGFAVLAAATAGALASVTAAAGALASVSAGAAAMSVGMLAASAAATAAGSASRAFASAFSSSMRSAAQSATSAAASIKSAISGLTDKTVRVHVLRGTVELLRFSMTGKFDPKTGAVPTASVSWYAKGGIFDSPSVIGVGEAGPEAVIPIDRLSDLLGDGRRVESNNVYFNGTFNGDAEIEELFWKLLGALQRKGRI